MISYRGVASAGTVASFVPAQGAAGPSVVTAASAPGEVVLDGVCGWAADSLLHTAGDEQEARWHWSTGSLSSAGSQKPGAPAVTMSWTESGAGTMEWGAAAIVLRPAGVVPSVPLDVQTAGCTVAGTGPGTQRPRDCWPWACRGSACGQCGVDATGSGQGNFRPPLACNLIA